MATSTSPIESSPMRHASPRPMKVFKGHISMVWSNSAKANMPLPNGATLSLVGHRRPGDIVQTKPKQAMLVRMSTEMLEALESSTHHPPMEFEFGENSGIHIGETFFAMRSLKESTPHEIYLRVTSAANPMAPLQLYANVTGKFIVERQLVEKVTDKARQQIRVAEEGRSERVVQVRDRACSVTSSILNVYAPALAEIRDDDALSHIATRRTRTCRTASR
ncbi:hypothetical protein BV22DRAFT_861485 [Leucogyrophana mollusca]|uniref:Uncharacterized protein n=1 Tax=Leucogyrophana mollusca TaxID=85980 RepID=A0ACB8B0R1_9AGAM|nr:hypothetical protein BV22DRAFT_861485 [Leucogyrophana mollusca]